MHMKGTPRDMQTDPNYDDLLGEVSEFFRSALDRAARAGIPRSHTILDPGIGFGKTVAHNLTLVNHLDEFAALGRPMLVGASRKSFIGKTLGLDSPADRLAGTLAVTALAVARGARILRVHDVRQNVRAVRMAEAVLAATPTTLTAEGAANAEKRQRLNGITEAVIGGAIAVHKALGPGLLESTYAACLEHELRMCGLKVEREKPLGVSYRGVRLDCGYRVDLLVEGQAIVELKAVKAFEPFHEAQLLTYLKLAGLKVGLLLNFNVPLLKDGIGIKRVVNNF